jgi:recombination protein RecA
MSQALRKLAGAINKSNCVAIFINQLREKVGVIYGNPEVTTGGRALKFYSSVRIDIRRIETLKVNGEMVGSRTRAKVVKNKIAPPFKEAEFDIMYGEGISRVGELIDLAVKADVMQKSGAWFYYGETRLGQGRDNVKELLKSDDRLRNEIEAKLWENVDKLSTRPKKTAKAAATPVAKAEPAPAPAPAPAADKKKKTSKIDILVED